MLGFAVVVLSLHLGPSSKFDYLQQGIAVVLIFIGLKMLGEHWNQPVAEQDEQVFYFLGVIMVCISGSIFYSILYEEKGEPPDASEDDVY